VVTGMTAVEQIVFRERFNALAERRFPV